MIAGTLDRRLTLQHRVLTRDAHGQEVVSYATYATVWCQRLDLNARERLASQQVVAEVGCKFKIRFRADLVATDQVICEGVTYNILPPAELGRRDALELMAFAVVP